MKIIKIELIIDKKAVNYMSLFGLFYTIFEIGCKGVNDVKNVIEDNEIVMIDTDEEKYSVISYDSRQYEYALAALDMIKKEDAE